MAMLNTSHSELRGILEKLEQAIFSHNQWYDDIIRTLVCRLPADSRDVEADAHHKCRFGQWYYTYASDELRTYPAFVAIENEHERVHKLAARILSAEASSETVTLLDYEHFNNSIGTLRLQLQSLKFELEDLLYNHDPLTRAHSRIGMLTKLREAQEYVKRNLGSCCVTMMDLDRFKVVNDTHGHQAGDQVLVGVAEHLMAHLRPYDKLFRYGGEEFLISLPQTDAKAGLDIVERLRMEIADCDIRYEGKRIPVTASFGLTLLDPDIAVEQSIKRADDALYAAKTDGRNCSRVWEASLGKRDGAE
jgi:diguanylate cyclase (GGDEF)-like protein